jgi:hypothetical protein
VSNALPHLEALHRHLADLRDGVHGGVGARSDKERLFGSTVDLLDPVARRALGEVDDDLLLGSGTLEATGVTRTRDGGVQAVWALSWPEQRAAGVPPVELRAHFERAFHHPHLRGTTVGDWPLNVFSASDAEGQLPVLRAIVAADVHNLVFRTDYSIVPAVVRGPG